MPPRTPIEKLSPLGVYFRHTRALPFNVVWVAFLLGLYEAATILSGQRARNAADVLLKEWMGQSGEYITPFVHVVLIGLLLASFVAYWRADVSPVRYFAPFLGECAVYAVFLAPLVIWVQTPVLAPSGEDLILDLGAGVYEEIVFRLLFVGGPLILLRLDPWNAFGIEDEEGEEGHPARLFVPLAFILLIASALFAGYHHVGDGADPFSWPVFGFRLVAGLLLSALYLARGLAAAVYTHTGYDLLVHGLSIS